jgi:hypothetical protein
MNQTLIARYQIGGDIYETLKGQYGQAAADQIAAAAQSGDETQINAALTTVKFGQPLNDSTASIFANQLATDPLAAPLASANTLLSNSFLSLFKNPAVLFVIVAAAFLWLGGLEMLKGRLAKK